MYASSGDVTIVGSEFLDNRALSGGATYFDDETEALVVHSFFSLNDAEIGGSIRNQGTLEVVGTRFIENKSILEWDQANLVAGAAIFSLGPLSCMDCIFADNSSNGVLTVAGGAIWSRDFACSIVNGVRGDLNGDGLTTFADLLILLDAWGLCR